VRQLWLATRSGGYHFDWDDDAEGWVRDSDGAPLTEVLAGELAVQCGEALEL
jgi:CyaY protein